MPSFVRLIVFLVAAAPAAACAGSRLEAKEPTGEAPPRPISERVWLATAATVGLATTTTVLGLAALDLRSDFDRANRDARQSAVDRTNLRNTALEVEHLATIAGLATIAAAATVLVLWVTLPVQSDPLRVRLALGFAGSRLTLSGGF